MLSVICYILFVGLCLLATIDTRLFVYQSLSRSLFLELGICLLSVVGLSACIIKRQRPMASALGAIVVVWVAYMALHSLLVTPHELYRTFYLSLTLLLVPTLACCLKARLLSRGNIETGLLAIAGIHIIYIVAQRLHIIDSGNAYFPLTGSNENPTVTALYLVGCLPMMAGRMVRAEKKARYALLLALTVAGIYLLNCRTAYIGLGVEAMVVLAMRFGRRFCRLGGLYKAALISVALLLVCVAGLRMYGMKQGSADGRLLIWRLSAEMISDRPAGYGYGMFERNYNLRQAEYFSGRRQTHAEKMNADFVYMPYNDYLEHGVEGGIVGMMFLAGFYALSVYGAVRRRMTAAAAVMSAFAVMSLTNFVYTSIQPWLLVMCHAALIAAEDATLPAWLRGVRLQRAVVVTLLLAMLAATYRTASVAMAQARLRQIGMEAGSIGTDDGRFAKIESAIGTSEAFWTRRAANSMANGDFATAVSYIHKARRYSSQPELLSRESECHMRRGNATAGIALIDTLSCMLPHNLTLKQLLMRHYASHGHHEEALSHAVDILETGAKFDTEAAQRVINEAARYRRIHGRRDLPAPPRTGSAAVPLEW